MDLSISKSEISNSLENFIERVLIYNGRTRNCYAIQYSIFYLKYFI